MKWMWVVFGLLEVRILTRLPAWLVSRKFLLTRVEKQLAYFKERSEQLYQELVDEDPENKKLIAQFEDTITRLKRVHSIAKDRLHFCE